jgi:hypothetical protein
VLFRATLQLPARAGSPRVIHRPHASRSPQGARLEVQRAASVAPLWIALRDAPSALLEARGSRGSLAVASLFSHAPFPAKSPVLDPRRKQRRPFRQAAMVADNFYYTEMLRLAFGQVKTLFAGAAARTGNRLLHQLFKGERATALCLPAPRSSALRAIPFPLWVISSLAGGGTGAYAFPSGDHWRCTRCASAGATGSGGRAWPPQSLRTGIGR